MTIAVLKTLCKCDLTSVLLSTIVATGDDFLYFACGETLAKATLFSLRCSEKVTYVTAHEKRDPSPHIHFFGNKQKCTPNFVFVVMAIIALS